MSPSNCNFKQVQITASCPVHQMVVNVLSFNSKFCVGRVNLAKSHPGTSDVTIQLQLQASSNHSFMPCASDGSACALLQQQVLRW